MSARPSRSSSIPIPPSSATSRNIENVISIPFSNSVASTGTPRPRIVSVTRPLPSAIPGTVSVSPAARRNVASSPVRSLASSYASVSRSPVNTISSPWYEPRIVRATTSPTRGTDPPCFPAAASPPTAVRARRPSSTRTVGGTPHPSAAGGVRTVSASAPGTGHTITHTQSQSFPRPVYLDHSALRDLLQTDAPATSVDARSTEAVARSNFAWTSASVIPAPVSAISHYPYLRRGQTPATDSEDESAASSPPPTTIPVSTGPSLMTNPVLRLPTRWSEQDRHPPLSVSQDGRELTFTGPPCAGDKDSAAARANHSIPPACGIYYYEVEILHKGSKGHISIGFSSPDVRLTRLPGWEKQSWGYHADDGWSFPGHKDGNPYGPTFDTGDIIGCGIDFSQHRAFYTKNGAFLGMVFENVGKGNELYPAVGLRHTGESIRVNFGHAPFKYAIEDYVHTQQNRVWADIQTTKINWDLLLGINKHEDMSDGEKPAKSNSTEDDETKAPLRKLVMSYLVHHGYAKTGRAFQTQCDSGTYIQGAGSSVIPKVEQDMDTDDVSGTESEQDRDLRTRVDIANAVLQGDIDTALAQTNENYPSVLEREQGFMLFKLRCRKFIELVLEASEALKKVKQPAEPQPQPDPTKERGRESQPQPIRPRTVVASPSASTTTIASDDVKMDGVDGEGAMDVDEPSHEAPAHASISSSSSTTPVPPSTSSHSEGGLSATRPRQVPVVAPSPGSPSASAPTFRSAPSPARQTSPHAAAAKAALHTALAYGQTLEADYRHDPRPELHLLLKRTFGVVAYTDPLAAGGEITELAGQEARVRLSNELNQAILESQGKPAHPALEMLYRQSAACIVQLGLLNVGAAAFADMSKEFLEG